MIAAGGTLRAFTSHVRVLCSTGGLLARAESVLHACDAGLRRAFGRRTVDEDERSRMPMIFRAHLCEVAQVSRLARGRVNERIVNTIERFRDALSDLDRELAATRTFSANIATAWNIVAVWESLRGHIPDPRLILVGRIADSLNDWGFPRRLGDDPQWRDAPAVSLEAPWPEVVGPSGG